MTPLQTIAKVIADGVGEDKSSEEIARNIISAISEPTTYMLVEVDIPWSVRDAWQECLKTLSVEHEFNQVSE